jgi:hypothetical protein
MGACSDGQARRAEDGFVDGDVVGGVPRIVFFAPDDPGQLDELLIVAGAGQRQFDSVGAGLPGPAGLGQREGEFSGFERENFHAAAGSGNSEASARAAERIGVVAPEGDRGFRIEQQGDLVVLDVIWLRGGGSGDDFRGFAEQSEHGIHEMAGEFEHSAALQAGEGLSGGGVGEFPHHGVDLEEVAKPPFTHGLEEPLEGGIGAEHVAHLHGESAGFGRLAHAFEIGVREGAWLVEVDVFPRVDGALGGGAGVLNPRLDGDGLQFGEGEERVLGELRQARKRFSQAGFGRAEPLHVVEGVEMAEGLEFSRGVRVFGSDLSDANAARRGGDGRGDWGGWSLGEEGGGGAEQRSEEEASGE